MRHRPTSSESSFGHAALPLIGSDAALQGARYVFIVYLGSQSLSDLGSFLMGGAVGSLLGVAADFGISQHWLRLGVKEARISRRTFTRTMGGKAVAMLLGSLPLVLFVIAGVWRLSAPFPAVAGLFLTVLQNLGESCEAVGLLSRRYAIVIVFRVLLSLGVYALPLLCAMMLAQSQDSGSVALAISATAGLGLTLVYIGKVFCLLQPDEQQGLSYGAAWWEARWLGMNQWAVVTDVRAPLIILGVMLGETAVGLYGMVQRTTAVVELAWASLSRLLVTSYSELAGDQDIRRLKVRVMHAGRLTAATMTGMALCLWGAGAVLAKGRNFSSETTIAFSLLQWAIIAIGLSSVKRPFVSGLIALYQERAVCRVNMLIAATGLALVPLLIAWFGIWGPVISWVLLEAVACLLIVHLFVALAQPSAVDLDPSLSRRVTR